MSNRSNSSLNSSVQAQAPAEIEQVIQQVSHASINLNPRELEHLTAAAARKLLHRVWRSRIPSDVTVRYVAEASTIVNELVFAAYWSGMKKAAKEFGRSHASPTQQDWQTIETQRFRFRADVNRLIQDMVSDAQHEGKLDMVYYERRSDLIMQMAVWSSYNAAKVAFYRRLTLPRTAMAQAATFIESFTFETCGDDAVCEICERIEIQSQLDPVTNIDDLPHPPDDTHPNCRCEIVANIVRVSNVQEPIFIPEEEVGRIRPRLIVP